MGRFDTRIEIDRKTGEPVELPPVDPLTEREWGIVMRILMDGENRIRNAAKDDDYPGVFGGLKIYHDGQLKRADSIRAIRLKLREQRKAAK